MFSRVSSLWKNPSRGRSLELFPFPNLAMKNSALKTMMIGRRSGFLLGPGAFSGAMRLCMLNFQGVLARVWYLSLAGCDEQRVALTGWSRFPSFHDEPNRVAKKGEAWATIICLGFPTPCGTKNPPNTVGSGCFPITIAHTSLRAGLRLGLVVSGATFPHPKGSVLEGKSPLFQGNLVGWNIVIWPEVWCVCLLYVLFWWGKSNGFVQPNAERSDRLSQR